MWSVDRFYLSTFLRAFETIEDKTLWGRGEEFVSTYPYHDVITKFSRMDSLPNFITRGAPLRTLRARRAPLSNGLPK